MLEELREQKNIEARYHQTRQTFNVFLMAGQFRKARSLIRNVYEWTREEELSHGDESFKLRVRSYSFSPSFSEANLEIAVTMQDGTQARAELYCPEVYKGLLPIAMNEVVERLSDIEEIVRNFNKSEPRIMALRTPKT